MAVQKKLLQSIHSDAATHRRYPPCMLEHKTVQQRGKMALDGKLADGNSSSEHNRALVNFLCVGSKRKCQVEAWTTANEFANLVLKQKLVSLIHY